MSVRGDVLFLLGYPRLNCRARLDGVYRYAAKCGMRIRVVENAYSRKDLREVVEFWRPIGMICSCGFGTGAFDFAPFSRIPTVYYDAPCRSDWSVSVLSDSDQIGQVAAREILQAGCRHAAYVPFFENLCWSCERGESFAAAMAKAGVLCQTFPSRKRTSAIQRLEGLIRWLLGLPKPCGVFAANDLVAEEVEIAAERARLRIPQDIVLIGVDNQEQLCNNLRTPLSSVQVDWEEGGFLATDKLVGLIQGSSPIGGVYRYSVLKVVRRMSTRVSATPAAVFANRLTSFMHDHVEEGLSIDLIVKESGYSRRQAEKLFRAGSGRSLLTAIHDAVYDRACVMAKSPNCSIRAIADALGGISRSQLDRIFVSKTGRSIRAWLERK